MKPTRQFKSALLLSLLVAFSIAQAKNNVNTPPPTAPAFTQKTTAAPCDPPTSSIDLDINNVRTRIHNGGDMWWDLVGSAKYEIPKGSDIHSLFAASIWIGGVDAGGQLKIAAQTYRQSGNDFWPGPLDSNGATVKETCSDWDRHFEVSRLEIDAFIENPDVIPTSILQWPGKGNPNQPLVAPFSNIGLAPFEDANADGIYDPADGDFPILMDECPGVRGDQMIWWIYNDKGNIHTETRGEAIGMEVQAMAFGFSTNDEINDMTFYRYVLINRSNTTLDSAFIAQWVDPDLGCFQDDYIGCDTSRSLGIVYNADATDEQCGSNGYGSEIPMLGIDYFRGPKDEFGKELGMSSFTYYLNDFSLMGNPESAPHYYGYLSGTWKDGTPFTCGGIAKGGSQTCKYVFPDDPTLPLPAWSECSVNTPPLDRRFVQASGPFSLAPGASNDVIVGVVWVSNVVYPCPSYKTLQAADDKAQALFDACFKLVDGPDAPDLTIRELENELILTLTNKDGSNNYKESYSQVDPTIISDVEKIGSADSAYIFEGYKIYQLASDIISIADVDDPDKARLVAQVDIENGIDQLINYTFDNLLGADVATEMVDGDDLGIVHTFKITQDQFALGDKTLINHWPYYFTAVAYAYNIYQPYDPANDTLLGQKKEYLEGRNNVKVYSAIPHKSDPLSGGTKLNSEYGDGPLITRIEGSGNGGRVLDLTDATVDLFFSKSTSFIKHLVYQENLGPIDVKVYDPLLVPKDGFKFYMQDTAGIKMGCFYPEIDKSSTWTLIDTTRGDTTQADRNLSTKNEQLFPDLGISITLEQVTDVFVDRKGNNNFLEAPMEFEEIKNEWLTGVPDGEGFSFRNWIRAGEFQSSTRPEKNDIEDSKGFLDPEEQYEDLLGGRWAPYALASFDIDGPAITHTNANYCIIHSIDLVFTSDESKWTRCVVLEAQEDKGLAQDGDDNDSDGAEKLRPREHAGWNKDGSYSDSVWTDLNYGLSWFPGYAINVETGERLNIMFAEDSWRKGAGQGDDMIWNPTSTLFTPQFEIIFGAKHYVYIMQSRYDENTQFITKTDLVGLLDNKLKDYYKNEIMWVGIPMVNPGFGFKDPHDIPTDVKIRIRVEKPYAQFVVDGINAAQPFYRFSTSSLAADTGLTDTASSAMDFIKVVPNPYYAYSTYETSQLDNRVKITNLPSKCKVSIYTINGTLIREFERDVASNTSYGAEISKTNLDSSLDWDLKNQQGIPIASGLYIIHIQADGLGEKVLKWFGNMRPIDLDAF